MLMNFKVIIDNLPVNDDMRLNDLLKYVNALSLLLYIEVIKNLINNCLLLITNFKY